MDENGEVVFDVFKKNCWENGKNFVISNSKRICQLITKVPTGSILRVFFYIAPNQQYGGDDLHFGFSCTRKHLEEVLNLNRKSIYTALKWLEENRLVVATKVNGNIEFMVNPNYVTIGTHKRKRIAEWERRLKEKSLNELLSPTKRTNKILSIAATCSNATEEPSVPKNSTSSRKN